jgi:hypothetical protein
MSLRTLLTAAAFAAAAAAPAFARCLRSNVRKLSPHCKGELVEAHAAKKQQEQQQPY